jgi:hypothetical protein
VAKQAATEVDKMKSEKLQNTLQHLQAENELLRHENQGFKEALYKERKRRKRAKQPFEQLRAIEGNAAVFVSPSKVVILRELAAQKEYDKQAQIASKQHDDLQQQARKVEAEKQRLQRLQKATDKRAVTAQKHLNLQARKDDKGARDQLLYSLELSAKKPAFKVVKRPDRKVGPVSRSLPKLGEEADIRPTTRSRVIRRPQRYMN